MGRGEAALVEMSDLSFHFVIATSICRGCQLLDCARAA